MNSIMKNIYFTNTGKQRKQIAKKIIQIQKWIDELVKRNRTAMSQAIKILSIELTRDPNFWNNLKKYGT